MSLTDKQLFQIFSMCVLFPLRIQVFMCWHVFGICHVRFVSSPCTSVQVLACVWFLSCTFCFLSVYMCLCVDMCLVFVMYVLFPLRVHVFMCWHVFGICHVRLCSSSCTRGYVLACVWYLSRTNVVLVDTICTACDMSVAFWQDLIISNIVMQAAHVYRIYIYIYIYISVPRPPYMN